MTSPTPPWWSPARHADRRHVLLARNRIKQAIRSWFLEQDFVEVDPGALVVSPGNELHLHAFRTELTGNDGARRSMYLHTSPEFACKKLIAAGERRIFTFAPTYRNAERGPLHAPEFTMLEWYRADGDEPYETIKTDCFSLARLAAGITGAFDWHWRGRTAEMTATGHEDTVRDAIAQLTAVDILASIDRHGTPDRDALAEEMRRFGIDAPPGDETWGDLFSKLIIDIERRYGELRGIATPRGNEPMFLLDRYPSVLSPLARPAPEDHRVAQRFEVFVAGIELANGFGEETDSKKVRTALAAEMDGKQRLYGERYPIDDDFITALAGMPPGTAGCALGFDRLVMLATGATHIDQVLWTPLPE